jgi:hypothetical protein
LILLDLEELVQRFYLDRQKNKEIQRPD